MIKKIIILFVVGVVSLGGGFYIRYSREGGLPAPILKNAIDVSINAESVKVSGSVAISGLGQASSTPAKPFVVEFTSAQDLSDLAKPKGSFSLSTEIYSFPMLMGLVDSGYIKIEGRSLEGVSYIKLNAFPQAIVDLTPFVNQWIAFDLRELAEEYKATIKRANVPTATQLDDLRTKLMNAQILRYVQSLPNTEINGQAMHHFAVILDQQRLINFLPMMMSWEAGVEGKQVTATEQTQLNEMIKFLRETPAQEYPAGEIFIGYDDGFVHRLNMSKTIRIAATPRMSALEFTIRLDTSFDGYNQPIVIEKPSNVQSLKEIIDEVSGAKNQAPVTIAFKEATDWLGSLPKDTQADFQAAANLIAGRYAQSSITRSAYSTGLSCSDFILQTAVNKLTATQLNALRAKSAALAQLQSDPKGKTSDVVLRKDIMANWTELVVMPGIISERGLAKVNDIDKSAPSVPPGPSKAACKTMPVPAKYK
jgi:hypothetical protein